MQQQDNVFQRPLRRTPIAFRAIFWTVSVLFAASVFALVVVDPQLHPSELVHCRGFPLLIGLALLADLYPMVPWLADHRDDQVFIWSGTLSTAAILAFGPWAALICPVSGLLFNLRKPGSRWWRRVLNMALFGLQGMVAAGVYLVLRAAMTRGEPLPDSLLLNPWQLFVAGIALAVVLLFLNAALVGAASVSLGVSSLRAEKRIFAKTAPISATSMLFAPLFAELALAGPQLLPLLALGIIGVHQVEGALSRTVRKARTDPLTGLANRSALLHNLEELLDTGGEVDVTVLVIDLDGFKAVNDNFGHPVGDQVLVATARRLTEALGPSALVARLGGDEFAVVLGAGTAVDEVRDLVTRLIETIGRPITIGLEQVTVSGSVGVATVRDGSVTPMELIGLADQAMYRSKSPRQAPPALVEPQWSTTGPEILSSSPPATLVARLPDALDLGTAEL